MKTFLALFALLALSVAVVQAADKDSQRPNIVVFISDDHSQLDSQAYGSTEVRTPNMAKLATEGLRFTHAFVASPSCGPSRSGPGKTTGRAPTRPATGRRRDRAGSAPARLPGYPEPG